MTAPVLKQLPPRMHLRSGRYYYVKRQESGKLVWTALSKDLSEALHQHALFEAGKTSEALDAGEPPQHWLGGMTRILHRQTAKRAREANILFELTVEDIAKLAVRTNWRCALTGIRFSRDEAGPKGSKPYLPSVDRINSGHGYTATNCRLVCVAVNFAMNSWGQETLHKVALAYVQHHGLAKPLENTNGKTKTKRVAQNLSP